MGPTKDKQQEPTHGLKLDERAVTASEDLKPRLYAQFAPWCKFTSGCKICVHMLLNLLFKHITNVSFYILKEKFDVLRMFRLLVSSRYRRVRKMQLHLFLFVLFIEVAIYSQL